MKVFDKLDDEMLDSVIGGLGATDEDQKKLPVNLTCHFFEPREGNAPSGTCMQCRYCSGGAVGNAMGTNMTCTRS